MEDAADAYVSSVVVHSEDRHRNGIKVDDGGILWLERLDTLEAAKAQSADLSWALKCAYLAGATK